MVMKISNCRLYKGKNIYYIYLANSNIEGKKYHGIIRSSILVNLTKTTEESLNKQVGKLAQGDYCIIKNSSGFMSCALINTQPVPTIILTEIEAEQENAEE